MEREPEPRTDVIGNADSAPAQSAESVVWTVETMEDDRESHFYTHSVHASFASADLLLKQLAQEYPEWVVRTRAWTLLNDGTDHG